MTFDWIERKDERIEAVVTHPGLSREVRLMAENIRDQQTGVHAHVTVGYGDPQNGRFDLIEDDTFNLGRRTDRNGFASAVAEGLVYRHNRETAEEARMPNTKSEPGRVFLQEVRTWMRDFCGDAWGQHVGHFRSQWRTGTEEARPPRWLLNPWALLDASMILFGREGGGKSTIMTIWALMVQHGIATPFGQPTESMPVLWVNLERPVDQVDDLLGNIAGAMGLPRDTKMERIDARGHGLRDIAPAIEEFVERHERRCLVALDSVSRAVAGDLIDNAVANAFANQMNAFGCPWWAIAHMAKDPEGKRKERSIFGAGAFAWAADVTVELSFEDRGLYQKIISLQTGKVANAPRSGLRTFVLDYQQDEGLVAFDTLAKDQAGQVGKSDRQVLVDRIYFHLARHGRQTYKQLSTAVQVTDRQLRNVMKDDARFGKTSTSPVLLYILERPTDGSRKSEKQSSMSSSDFHLDPSGRVGEDVGGTGGGTTYPSPSSSDLPTSQPADQQDAEAEHGSDDRVPTSDSTTCWHCGNVTEVAARDPDGRPVCDACVEAVMDEVPMDED